MLTGLDQKVKGMVGAVWCCFTRSMIPPVNRQTLIHRVKLAEQGRPNYLHLNMEGEPIDKWVEEVGKSESHFVMEWIGVQNLPNHESEQTSDRCWITRNTRMV